MSDEDKSPSVSAAWFTQTGKNAGATLVLTLLVWVLCYEAHAQLRSEETFVVALAALILVLLVQSLLSWLGRVRTKPRDTH